MAKLYTYVMINVGLLVLLLAAGINTNTGNTLINFGLLNPGNITNIESTPIWLAIISVTGIVSIAATVVIGIFGRQISTLPLSATLATTILVAFVADLAAIITFANAQSAWGGWLAFLILAPFTAGYIIALYDWVRSGGSD